MIFLKAAKHLRLASKTVDIYAKQCGISTSSQLYNKPREPVKFSTSKAKSHNPMDTFIPSKSRARSPMQPFIVIGSFLVFFTYFALIREENSFDTKFEKSLDQSVPNIKELTIQHQIDQYEKMGLNTSELKKALKVEKLKHIKNL